MMADMLPAHDEVEKQAEGFPEGFPIRCPSCHNPWRFYYVSERSGNIRRYTCKDCDQVYLATWKGSTIKSVLGEPRNTKMEDWSWAKVISPPALPEPKRQIGE